MSESTFCCEAMEVSVEYSRKHDAKMRHTAIPGFVRIFLMGNKEGRETGNHLAYHIPAQGRGRDRVLSKNIVLNFCPFCGHEYQKSNATTVVDEEQRQVLMGVVPAENILRSPRLRLDARYYLDAEEKPQAVINGRSSRK